MTSLFVYRLRFEAAKPLEDAFRSLMDEDELPGCSIEPEAKSVRFIAPDSLGARLVETIYLGGGLRWCSRHPIAPPSVDVRDPAQ